MSQYKFGRNYILYVGLEDGTILNISPPFTIEFNIIRKNLGSLNTCQIRIYNLSPRNRNLIRYDMSDYSTVRKIEFYAGYGMNLPLIFIGNISQAWSIREGVDFITTIESYDGGDGLINGIISGTATFAAGTTLQNMYKILMSYMPNTTFGAIGPSFIYSDPDTKTKLLTNTRATSYTGNAGEVLRNITGGAFFIDLGKTYILGDNECINGSVAVVNSQSGLLNTPLRENSIVTVDMIFEPGIVLSQYIQLESSTFPQLNSNATNQSFNFATNSDNVNGYYKITSLIHRGMISESVCGDVITTLEFFAPNAPLSRVAT
jgi:hypothetical protein